MTYRHPLYHWPPRHLWRKKRSPELTWDAMAAYIHFPFCRYLCDFCGYETRLINGRASKNFPKDLVSQINWYERHDDFSEATLDAVFFGGGTASIMPISGMSDIVRSLRRVVATSKDIEITLECEPGTISERKLAAAAEIGVNRISVCAQSFDNDVLTSSGRKHSAADSIELIKRSHSVGISNIHVDLIYGLPNQTFESWMQTIETLASLPVDHVSVYKLYVFNYSALARNGNFRRPENETERETHALKEMHDSAHRALEEYGLSQYTLTEYAREGKRCRYIETTFQNRGVMPVGPGAFGTCGREVWTVDPTIHNYADSAISTPQRSLNLSRSDWFKRTVLLGLWLLEVDLEGLCQQNDIELSCSLMDRLYSLNRSKLLEFDGKKIRLRRDQRFFAGAAMNELAALDASQWIVESGCEKIDSVDTSHLSDRERVPVELKLSTLLKVARRDRDLLESLKDSPGAALKRLGFSIDTDVEEYFIAMISDGLNDERFEGLSKKWRDVLKENA